MNKKRNLLAIVAVMMLVALLSVCLVACNADTYRNKLEKKGYTVTAYTPAKEDADKVSWGVTGGKGREGVTVIKFTKIEYAKDFETEFKKQPLIDIERQSSIVFFGSEQGIKDAK